VQQEKAMSGSRFTPDTFTFNSTFGSVPVVIQYEVDVSEDHRGRDVTVVPTLCLIGEHGIDLCEDAGFFHPAQLKTWLAKAEANYKSLGQGADDTPDDDLPSGTLEYLAAAAEDHWIAQRERAHYSRAGL
jgi:hypothetical protein